MKMKKMTYSEYITTKDSGLFVEMDKIQPFEWNDLYTPERLDILFLFEHGDKPILKSLKTISLEVLAEMVYTSYSIKWCKIFKVLSEDVPVNQAYQLAIDEHIASDDEMNVFGESFDKEGAFNSDDLVVDSGNENSVTTGDKINRNRETTQTRTDNETMLKNMKFIEDNLFTDVVFKDVSNLINLKIYS